MRQSHLFLPTERQPPADAEALSHKLMVRAGLIRQVGAGLWSWLPAGWRVHEKVVDIIREEMDAIGGQELLMPVMHPAELWKKTGRYGFSEQFRLDDRKGAPHVLAMTHEEVVTFHVGNSVRSYRQLPMMLYHFQVKERDEPRPRAGVLRTREFIMKDSYSFDLDEEGLQVSYDKHAQAYARMLDRAGIEWYSVESDVGMMGGSSAHEFMAPCGAGEDDVALAPGYAANVEVASATPQPVPHTELTGDQETPGLTTIEAVAEHLGARPGQLLKAFPVVTESRGLVMAFVRGDHRVNEIKLRNALKEELRPATPAELEERGLHAGFLGPTGDLPSVFDEAIVPGPYIVGANRPDLHTVVEIPAGERLDFRTVEAGDTVNGNPITIEPAIEVGNIFKLGTRYSEPLGATVLDTNGKDRHVVMGCYGMGPARIAAAAVEQFADEKGISWPKSIAPWDVHVIAAGKPGTDEANAAAALYDELRGAGLEVLLDDRADGPGAKFADAELLGVPLRLTVGKRGLAEGKAEAMQRRGLTQLEGVALDDPIETVKQQWLDVP
ncbi:MAG TPA: proline--tRNA ligase [Solirubrobacteraceae bacterium]|nr:proline--tRNA ligase [Solirubrobacteraceae bacterium]